MDNSKILMDSVNVSVSEQEWFDHVHIAMIVPTFTLEVEVRQECGLQFSTSVLFICFNDTTDGLNILLSLFHILNGVKRYDKGFPFLLPNPTYG